MAACQLALESKVKEAARRWRGARAKAVGEEGKTRASHLHSSSLFKGRRGEGKKGKGKK